MPIIQNSHLPAYQKLIAEGVDIHPKSNQPTLNIGLINMMPDAALKPTEQQFLRLLAGCNIPIKLYLFSIEGLKRSKLGQQHIEDHYSNFKHLERLQQRQELHALIISGSNVPLGAMSDSPFWSGLTQVFNLLCKHYIPTLFTCLATHAALEFFYKQKRQPLPEKCWGIFQHYLASEHTLLNQVDKTVYVPHSRFNTITLEQFEAANITPLIKSDEVGVHLAVCNSYPFTFFQGHPEYDAISLLKEYKREIILFYQGQRSNYPIIPANYLQANATKLLIKFKASFIHQIKSKQEQILAQFPEENITSQIKNSWFHSGSTVINNWVNQIQASTTKT